MIDAERLVAWMDARGLRGRGHWRAKVFQSADAREGAAAFVERRAPVWRGR